MQAGEPGPLIYGQQSENEVSGGFGDQYGAEREERQTSCRLFRVQKGRAPWYTRSFLGEGVAECVFSCFAFG